MKVGIVFILFFVGWYVVWFIKVFSKCLVNEDKKVSWFGIVLEFEL